MTRIHELGRGAPIEPVLAVSYVVMRPGETENDVAQRLGFCQQAAERNGQVILPTWELIEHLSDGSACRPAWRLVRNMIVQRNARHIYYFGENDGTYYSEYRRRTLRRTWSQRGVLIHFLGGEVVRPPIVGPTITQPAIADAAPARTTEHYRGIVL